MKCPVLVLTFLLASAFSFAQTEDARISGRVTDPTDAVIVGAECKITNLETNASTITTTNQDGIYVIPDLRPSTYRLTIQKEGFRLETHRGGAGSPLDSLHYVERLARGCRNRRRINLPVTPRMPILHLASEWHTKPLPRRC
jgi:hypothetical protein